MIVLFWRVLIINIALPMLCVNVSIFAVTGRNNMFLQEKRAIKSQFKVGMILGFILFIGWVSDVSAFPAYFSATGVVDVDSGKVGRGCSDAGCHDGAAVTRTCNGCHAHGSHSNNNKDDINITATTDATTYNVGDTITITVAGGYKFSWVRATIYNENMDMIAQSTGICDATISTGTACANGDSLPVTLAIVASTTGTHTWTAGLYSNQTDATGAAGGINGTQSTSVAEQGWLPDATNANHGEEIVPIGAFTVTTGGGGGGGSLSLSVLGLLLFGVIGKIVRGRRRLS